MKKIVVIGPVPPYKGGLSHFNFSLVNELRKNNEVKEISWKRQYPKIIYPIDPISKSDEEKINHDNKFILDFYNPVTWLKASRIIKKYSPDIIIFTWASPITSIAYTTISKKTKNIEKLVICHNVLQHEGTFIDSILRNMFFRSVDNFIVHSRNDLANIKSLTKSKNIALGFHPIYDKFKSESKTFNKIKNTILFFGYIREYKGLIYLIRAMPEIIKAIKIKLLIVGEFWENKNILARLFTILFTGRNRTGKSYYINEIERLGIKDYVDIVDCYVPDREVGKYFSRSDVLVLPYTSATQSGPLQIAYNFNIPVICTNVGGLPDVVGSDKTGFLVQPKDCKSLAKAVIRFYKEDKKKEFIANIKNVKKKYSWSSYAKLIENFM